MNIGEKIKQYRQMNNMTQYKLSQLSGLSQGHIKDIESGRRNPSVGTVQALIVPFGITLSEFFSDDGEVSVLSEGERELVGCYRRMSKARAEALLALAKSIVDRT